MHIKARNTYYSLIHSLRTHTLVAWNRTYVVSSPVFLFFFVMEYITTANYVLLDMSRDVISLFALSRGKTPTKYAEMQRPNVSRLALLRRYTRGRPMCSAFKRTGVVAAVQPEFCVRHVIPSSPPPICVSLCSTSLIVPTLY